MKHYCVFRHLPKFDPRAGMLPLVRLLNAEVLEFDFFWEKWEQRSWRVYHALRTFGNRYYQSTWNGFAPWLDEHRFLKAIASGPSIVHFLWAEFGSPRRAAPYHRKGAKLVGTFHCSARRLPTVLKGYDPLERYDYFTLMSKTQIPYLLDRGVAEDRMKVILHGVDTEAFCPAERTDSDKIRLLLVGDTERDHAFAAKVFDRLPHDKFVLSVKTREPNWSHYDGVDNVKLLPRLSGDELIEAYQQADLLFIPLLDCTANNAVLEAMACGTPVMTNRVGGIPEYVSNESSIVLENKDIDLWVDTLNAIEQDRDALSARRAKVRLWAEAFDWRKIVDQYFDAYREAAG